MVGIVLVFFQVEAFKDIRAFQDITRAAHQLPIVRKFFYFSLITT